jgi:hypothetical protein
LFIVAPVIVLTGLAIFTLVHVVQVILTGFFNNIRSMVTGRFIVKHEGVGHEA